ncbi:36544_t:CDS:2, partial [Racocetra persica]
LQNCQLLKPYKELIELWISKVENIFGILKDDQTIPLTQRVAVSSGTLNDDQILPSIQRLREKISTSNNDIVEPNINKESNIETIKQDLVDWYDKYTKFRKNEKIEKLKHFVSIKYHYNNLWYAATQETPPESDSLNNKQKAFADIPFGTNLPPKIFRGYISHFISSTIKISEKYKRKI